MAFNFAKTDVDGAFLIEPKVFGDERGFFMETYRKDEFEKAGIATEFVQDNHSKSKKGVLRGLHFQTAHTQAKLVRVIRGAVLDVVVDLRKASATYGKYVAEILSSENKRQLFVPKGCAHGFLTLEDDTEFVYKCDDYYEPAYDGGIIWNDSEIAIPWQQHFDTYGILEPVLSDKDTKHPTFSQFSERNPF